MLFEPTPPTFFIRRLCRFLTNTPITYIGANAFQGLSRLQSMFVPSSCSSFPVLLNHSSHSWTKVYLECDDHCHLLLLMLCFMIADAFVHLGACQTIFSSRIYQQPSLLPRQCCRRCFCFRQFPLPRLILNSTRQASPNGFLALPSNIFGSGSSSVRYWSACLFRIKMKLFNG